MSIFSHFILAVALLSPVEGRVEVMDDAKEEKADPIPQVHVSFVPDELYDPDSFEESALLYLQAVCKGCDLQVTRTAKIDSQGTTLQIVMAHLPEDEAEMIDDRLMDAYSDGTIDPEMFEPDEDL